MTFGRHTAFIVTSTLLLTGLGLVYATGGTMYAFTHLLYVPILFAAIELGLPAGIITALLAGLGLGLIPANVAAGEPQTGLAMSVRAFAFLAAACITGTLVHHFRRQQVRVQNGFVESVAALVNALEAADDFTGGHSQRVSEIATTVAEALHLPPEQVEVLRIGAMLHDVGKVAVPGQILAKPGQLTAEELRIVRTHPEVGDRILSALHHPQVEAIRDLVRHHHERLDGSGYPDGLAGRKLSTLVRILSVADVYDAMTSPRPHRQALSEAEAMAELASEAEAGRLDHLAVQTLVQLVQTEGKRWEIDSLSELEA
ncbi:MAG: putative metal-dependent phosphohydrolase [Symbiobacteriaceae bacterium]|nr:putative metal-dependent phosphohydrolase [Symbiobacteriaceae bacterium]